MAYPPSSPGYPPAPQSGSQYGATQQFAKTDVAPGESKLPEILLAVVAAAGLITYLVSFALEAAAGLGALPVLLSLLAGLLAGVSLLPKQKNYVAVVSVIATFALLLAISDLVATGGEAGWALYTILVLTLIQAGSAIAALLFDSGVLTPPAPKPAYEQQPQYGQYGGPSQYYGQQSQPQVGGQPYGQSAPQRPGYPSQYGSYPGSSGFPSQSPQGAPQGGQQSGPPTPPTGFPTYGQPQQQSGSSAPTTQVPAQPQAQQPSSQQSGQSSS
ncbi:DUF5336 domain-containing protein [Mycolicibacterium wolinskyi]|uniref:Antigen n=1 Tax=Mycolicibacterium wolinskyi TaxID=59750 RepID=A0A1X2FDT9_9MYCO|nr:MULTISPECIES: DUF5336 domain-containing protein [Mycolicibacterium]MCV7284519.1 DUF5336 domain-containing protein [Mycolicibacterium wolinskyi]MCV7291904.1 DUF5336 domain-containing protein [Mycolicibacterium goodii]ORX16601.1 hypothetical protein AWC31_21515 [Mycolicibacterium wolinskyi]